MFYWCATESSCSYNPPKCPLSCELVNLTDLSGVERYFCFWNFFSRPMSCSSVKMVRLRRGFFRRGVLCSVSDSLLMLRGVWLGEVSDPLGCCGESSGRCEGTPPAEDIWGTWGGCLVMTERNGLARSDEEPERGETVPQMKDWEKSNKEELEHLWIMWSFSELLCAPQSCRLEPYRPPRRAETGLFFNCSVFAVKSVFLLTSSMLRAVIPMTQTVFYTATLNPCNEWLFF